MIEPFWAIIDEASGTAERASVQPDASEPLVLVDGWIARNESLAKLAAGEAAELGGDAAVLAYNPLRKTTLAQRDAFGVHPVYFSRRQGRVHIASSIAGLRESGTKLAPDPVKNCLFVASHYRYFEFPERSTFFLDVQSLRPGEFLSVTPGHFKIGRYWQLEPLDLAGQTEAEVGEEFLHRLTKSVSRQLELTQRPAFTLSSGMDSCTVACLATRMNGPQVLVTTAFDVETEHDESHEVAKIAAAIGGEWLKLVIAPGDVLDAFERFSVGSDEPCATVTQMLHRIVTERLRERGHDAVFSGLGGDEASCGEIEEYLYYFADLKRLGLEERIKRDMPGWIKYHGTPAYPKNRAVLDRFLSEQIDFSVPGRNKLNAPRFYSNFAALSKDVDPRLVPVPVLPNPYPEHLLNKLYQDLFFEAVPCVLRAETANARVAGLPTLYPYLDSAVMTQGFSTPLALRYRDGVTKAVLRAATKGLVPDSARTNPYKRGWNAPVDRWLLGRMRDEVQEILSDRAVTERGVYDIRTIRRMLDQHVRGESNHMMFFWQLVSYERWYRHVASYEDSA